MSVKKTGEFGWIDGIRDRFSELIPAGMKGIGDDCAVIPTSPEESFVITTDMLVENVHFLRERISPADLGHKSLAVNLSDIAAMGAHPTASFLSIGLPADISPTWRGRFLDGYYALSKQFDIPLLGGDTTASQQLVINVTALGKAHPSLLKYRSGAKAGDIICVTGNLGDSAAGLNILREKTKGFAPDEKTLVRIHNRPEPQVNMGIWLGKQQRVHALMDVSDGIASDLLHILEESHVAGEVFIDTLPISGEMRRTAAGYGWDSEKLASTGGEDYVLLLTVKENAYDDLNRQFSSTFGLELKKIGKIIPGNPVVHWKKKGQSVLVDWHGFSHF